MSKAVTLKDIDAFIYQFLSKANELMVNNTGKEVQPWIKANQNSPAPALPYGYWYLKEMLNVGHKDSVQEEYNPNTGKYVSITQGFFTFSVEITSLGYGSVGIMNFISQFFDTQSFAFDAEVAGIGYQTHSSATDLSAVADAEVREAVQTTVTFNCMMELREEAGVIDQVIMETDLDAEGGKMYVPQYFVLVNNDGIEITNVDGNIVAKKNA